MTVIKRRINIKRRSKVRAKRRKPKVIVKRKLLLKKQSKHSRKSKILLRNLKVLNTS